LSGCGAASNTRRCISEPTTACPRPARRSAAISISTITAGLIRALTWRHPIKPTSTRCRSAWQPNPSRRSTYRRGKSVQTTGATSVLLPLAFFGWQHHTGIIRLSRSDEMRKWSIGGSYDRPIPRRIAEEAGIPRTWFGTKKMAVTVSAGQRREDDEVSPELQQLLEKRWAKNSTPLFRLKQTSINFANHTILWVQALYGSSSRQSSIMPTSPESQTRVSGMISKVRTTVKYSKLRRKYIRPVKPISFAAQVQIAWSFQNIKNYLIDIIIVKTCVE